MEPFEASIPPDFARLRGLRHDLRSWLERVDVPSDEQDAAILAISEAAANSIEHANGRVTVRGVRDADKLLLVVSNEGRWRNASPGSDRGRGLTIIETLMSRMEITARGESTTVRLRLDLPETNKLGSE
jgi:anti-sigma regulatory factor (Ser/Thr protein kinase)